jgi:hypothetical protein
LAISAAGRKPTEDATPIPGTRSLDADVDHLGPLYGAAGVEAAGGYGAVYWSPDTIVIPDDTTPDSLRALVDAAAADDQVHRFGVWRDNPAPVLAALMRERT